MTSRLLPSSALVIVIVGSAIAQTSAPNTTSDGLLLLQRVSQHYAEAKLYRIEAVEENTFHNDFFRSWSKTVVRAVEAPDNRFRYEGHSADGDTLKIGDGKTVWTYHIDEHRYTRKPLVPDAEKQPRRVPMSENALIEAENVRKGMSELARNLKSATRLPDSTVNVSGRYVPCYVVRIQNADLRHNRNGFTFERTVWIDMAHETVLRDSEHAETYRMVGTARLPAQHERTMAFEVVELDGRISDEYFTFTPPPGAELIDDFPDPVNGLSSLAGSKAPLLQLTSADGTVVSLESFRGRPVLLDVWATWCGPCLPALADMASL